MGKNMKPPTRLPGFCWALTKSAGDLRKIKTALALERFRLYRELKSNPTTIKGDEVLHIVKREGQYTFEKDGNLYSMSQIHHVGEFTEMVHKPTAVKVMELQDTAFIDSITGKQRQANPGDFIVISHRNEIYGVDRVVIQEDYREKR